MTRANLSNDEIILVLQYYEYDVEQAINAFLTGLYTCPKFPGDLSLSVYR